MPISSFVESDFWCFDAWSVPQQYPAQEVQDIFYLSANLWSCLSNVDPYRPHMHYLTHKNTVVLAQQAIVHLGLMLGTIITDPHNSQHALQACREVSRGENRR